MVALPSGRSLGAFPAAVGAGVGYEDRNAVALV